MELHKLGLYNAQDGKMKIMVDRSGQVMTVTQYKIWVQNKRRYIVYMYFLLFCMESFQRWKIHFMIVVV